MHKLLNSCEKHNKPEFISSKFLTRNKYQPKRQYSNTERPFITTPLLTNPMSTTDESDSSPEKLKLRFHRRSKADENAFQNFLNNRLITPMR
ncbi:hypothetical protein L1887_15044 [Cichorium endivia]|nr:hypothetical protein L1887_15044 [Cichorium endivia]